MERLLAEALAAGAWGLSSGLFTAPGCHADGGRTWWFSTPRGSAIWRPTTILTAIRSESPPWSSTVRWSWTEATTPARSPGAGSGGRAKLSSDQTFPAFPGC